MKSPYKKTIPGRVFLAGLLFLVIILTGCAGLKPASQHTSTKIKGKKEILVARDVTNRRPIWCGRKAALVYSVSDESASWEEIFWFDVETGGKIKVAEPGTPMACTADGEWLVYRDNGSYRREKGNPDNAVVDLWRYELKTKRRQKIAVAYETEVSTIGEGVLSPTGLKLYLGRKPKEFIEMSEPEWEIVWSQNKMHDGVWLSDSSGMVRTYFNWKSKTEHLALELLSPRKKLIILEPPLTGPARSIQMIGPNRVYLRTNIRMKGFEAYGKDFIVSCEINRSKATLSCADVLELKHGIRGYDLLSDNETIVFTEYEDRCIRIKRKGESAAPCITAANFDLGNHLTVSPDDRWVAFTVFRKREDGTSYTEDLYVVNLEKD
ncbi:MAG: hypothetical protein ACE5EB_04355 [Thermodesulfobacteriota bacterium]